MILSVIWILCCLPIVTIGPATTAMYYVVLRMHDPNYAVLKDFFRSFKQNFLQAFVAGLFVCFFMILLYLDLSVLLKTSYGQDKAPWFLFALVLFLAAAWSSWVFPMLAKFECSWGQLFKTPAKLAILHFLTTVMMCLVNLVPVVLFFAYPDAFWSALPFVVFLGPAGLAYINCIQLKKAFRWYIPVEPTEEETGEEDEEEEYEEPYGEPAELPEAQEERKTEE